MIQSSQKTLQRLLVEWKLPGLARNQRDMTSAHHNVSARTLAQLQNLEVSASMSPSLDNASVSRNILEHIVAPSSETLKLFVHEDDTGASAASPDSVYSTLLLHNFVLRSQFNLSHFSLDVQGCTLTNKPLIDFLSHASVCSTLRTLVIHQRSFGEPRIYRLISDILIAFLSRRPTTSAFEFSLPVLRTLSFIGDRILRFSSRNGALAQMLKLLFEQAGLQVSRVELSVERRSGTLMKRAKPPNHHDERGILALQKSRFDVQVQRGPTVQTRAAWAIIIRPVDQ